MKKSSFQLLCITVFILVMFALFTLTSCNKNDSDLDLKQGMYKLFSPISIEGEELNTDFWRITDDSLIITRHGGVVYADRIVWHGKRIDLFPFHYNPYYPDDMSMGQINTIWWGFFYVVPGLPTFTLQKEI